MAPRPVGNFFGMQRIAGTVLISAIAALFGLFADHSSKPDMPLVRMAALAIAFSVLYLALTSEMATSHFRLFARIPGARRKHQEPPKPSASTTFKMQSGGKVFSRRMHSTADEFALIGDDATLVSEEDRHEPRRKA